MLAAGVRVDEVLLRKLPVSVDDYSGSTSGNKMVSRMPIAATVGDCSRLVSVNNLMSRIAIAA